MLFRKCAIPGGSCACGAQTRFAMLRRAPWRDEGMSYLGKVANSRGFMRKNKIILANVLPRRQGAYRRKIDCVRESKGAVMHEHAGTNVPPNLFSQEDLVES